MNQNIEVINENLWAVNQEYVKQGYIQELQLIRESPTWQINLSNTGIIILSKEAESYPVFKVFCEKVIRLPTEELKKILNKFQSKEELDNLEIIFENAIGWEIKRRAVKAEYLKNLPKPTLKNKFIIWIREKVIKWQV